ncbi:MAG: hypothetical protein HFI29_15410 [Lachnospiraceae bacterium]|nr:hypothetical protein [Lachnospiraceae bacterium]
MEKTIYGYYDSFPVVCQFIFYKNEGKIMDKEDLEEELKQEIETEAAMLERRVNAKEELTSLTMPDDSYEQLMKHIQEKEQRKLKAQNNPGKKYLSYPRNAITTAIAVMLLVTLAGLGVNGARLYILNVENRERNNKPEIAIDTEKVYYGEIGEDEAYKKIEEEIGILALRLGNKPNGMELKKVYIDAEMGEALMEFYCEEHIITIYENKQNKNASFNTQLDGKIVDVIKAFYLDENIDIKEIDKGNEELFYAIQLEYGNAYYYVTSDIELTLFKEIAFGIMFVNI